MRGGDERSGSLFSYVDLEGRVGKDHPLRTIRGVVNEALAALSHEFSALYSRSGRPSIPPEKLLRAMLLQAFYSIRSERQLMERLEFDLLFRWFVGIGVDDAAWDHSTFSKNRERLLEGDIAAKLLSALLSQPRVKRLLGTDHFSVDGAQEIALLRDPSRSPVACRWTSRTTRPCASAMKPSIMRCSFKPRRVAPRTDGLPAHPACVADAEGAHARTRRQDLHLSRDHDQPTSGGGSRSCLARATGSRPYPGPARGRRAKRDKSESKGSGSTSRMLLGGASCTANGATRP